MALTSTLGVLTVAFVQMIRLYFDWNALVGLKNDRPPGLKELVNENLDRFHIFFSTAHIGDIYKGYNSTIGITTEIESDLIYLEELTDGNFFYYNKPLLSD